MKIAVTGSSGRIGRAIHFSLCRESDCKDLKQLPGKVLRYKCPSVCDLFTAHRWKLPESIDLVYDSSLAQQVSGWSPSYGFEEVTRLLDARIREALPAQATENTIWE